MTALADRIRQVRKKMNLTQAEFAGALRITRGHVSSIETGHAIPSDQLLALLCEIFFVQWDWLVLGEGPMYREREIESLHEKVHQEFFDSLLARLSSCLAIHNQSVSLGISLLNEQWKGFSPEYCPPELLKVFHDFLKIPELERELLTLIKERLKSYER